VVAVVGDLGSVHRVRVRAGGRDATVEVIVADDGARPRLVTLPDPRSAPPAAAPTAAGKRNAIAPGAPAPSPAKSAARFDTQFE
jgi:hypothetical protein